MKEKNTDYLLEQAATRAAESEFFLARVFNDYERLENLNAPDLARYLGCNLETLTRLALCRRPTSGDPNEFKSDIRKISQHFDIDANKLAALVRYVDTMKSFSESPQLTEDVSEQGILLTARDQEEPSEHEENGKEETEEAEPKEEEGEDDSR